MIEPVFHVPHFAELAGSAIAIASIALLRWRRVFPWIQEKPFDGFVSWLVFLGSLDCTRASLHKWEIVLYFAWRIFSALFPCDRLRKKLGSKLSSMTEVAKAAAAVGGILVSKLPPVLVPHPHVRVDPNVLGGSPYVIGSRIPVRRIYAFYQAGASFEKLAKRYPQLGPAKVLDALSFTLDNEDVVKADIEREETWLRGKGAIR